MPEKSPEFWAGVLLALREHGLTMMLTFVLSYLRIRLYGDQPSILRSLLEASVGALLVMIVGLAVNAAGLNVAWTLLTSGFIGILGIDQVRVLSKRWAERQVEGR
ncbi:phage holin, lambda family [Azotobacter salinestris]|uniref:phage holin, lambda family n=1 Tax=Azotobacter salinestris TaxID=69964 RepID=UPI001FCCAE51|nr:phage holin, lambda family [Azotobacter salinestris]